MYKSEMRVIEMALLCTHITLKYCHTKHIFYLQNDYMQMNAQYT